MWIAVAIVAGIAAFCNIIWCIRKKETSVFCFISLSFTALTVCAFYQMVNKWVAAEDWSALFDVVPAMSRVLWIGTIASVLINGIVLLKKRKQ